MRGGTALLVALLLAALAGAARGLGGSAEADKAALLSLKAASATNALQGWNSSSMPCGQGTASNWPYVFCREGRVVRLDTSGVRLDATLPDDLANLSDLWILCVPLLPLLPALWVRSLCHAHRCC